MSHIAYHKSGSVVDVFGRCEYTMTGRNGLLTYRIRYEDTSARWVLSQVYTRGDRTYDKALAEAPGQLVNAMPPETHWTWRSKTMLKSTELMNVWPLKVRPLKDYAVNRGGRGGRCARWRDLYRNLIPSFFFFIVVLQCYLRLATVIGKSLDRRPPTSDPRSFPIQESLYRWLFNIRGNLHADVAAELEPLF
jgi:hypothetical protein